MKSLLLVAHGSRRQASNDEVRALITRLRAAAGSFDHLDCAFLELAEPSIADGLRQAIAKGASEVVVLPYFLSAGRHVVTDIPAEIEPVRKAYPSVDIFLAPYLGAAEGVVELLMEQASRTINDYPAKTDVRPD
jgi:sirohydrochlorin ferrochelatase